MLMLAACCFSSQGTQVLIPQGVYHHYRHQMTPGRWPQLENRSRILQLEMKLSGHRRADTRRARRGDRTRRFYRSQLERASPRAFVCHHGGSPTRAISVAGEFRNSGKGSIFPRCSREQVQKRARVTAIASHSHINVCQGVPHDGGPRWRVVDHL